MSLYEKYAMLKEQTGMSDYAVAKHTGIAGSTLSDWRRGLYVPKVDKLYSLAKFFNVPIEYFLEDSDEEEG